MTGTYETACLERHPASHRSLGTRVGMLAKPALALG
jgi:hypothetical protein